jgi:hypothetical protein
MYAGDRAARVADHAAICEVRSMGVRLWCYQRRGPGDLQQLSPDKLMAFHGGHEELHADDDGFVRYVELLATLNRRRVGKVNVLGFFQARFGAALAHRERISRGISAPAYEKSRWQPLDSDQQELRAVVNRRAGRAVLSL